MIPDTATVCKSRQECLLRNYTMLGTILSSYRAYHHWVVDHSKKIGLSWGFWKKVNKIVTCQLFNVRWLKRFLLIHYFLFFSLVSSPFPTDLTFSSHTQTTTKTCPSRFPHNIDAGAVFKRSCPRVVPHRVWLRPLRPDTSGLTPSTNSPTLPTNHIGLPRPMAQPELTGFTSLFALATAETHGNVTSTIGNSTTTYDNLKYLLLRSLPVKKVSLHHNTSSTRGSMNDDQKYLHQ